jgi:hypothetical protein
MTPSTTGAVPALVRTDGETVVVDRAWPLRVTTTGVRAIRFEGRDECGRLRAGRLDVGGGASSPTSSATLTPYGVDRRLPGLTGTVHDGELIVHRLGRRAVVRQADRYVKVLRPGPAAGAVSMRSRVGAEIAATAGFATPAVLADGDGRLDLSILGGISLHEAGQSMDLGEWRVAWDGWASGWLAATSSHRGAEEPLPIHTATDELTGLHSWLGHIHAFSALSRLQHRLTRRCAELAEDLAATTSDPLVVSHRDLHDKQLLWDGTTIGLLDLDTLARAEAACDLANLAVHAEFRTLQGLWSVEHRDVVLDRVTEVADTLEVSPRRLAAYAEATRLRLTMLYSFRPRWVYLMAEWLDQPPLSDIA